MAYPDTIATDADLLIAENQTNKTGTPSALSDDISSVSLTIPMVDTTGYPVPSVITIGAEIIKVLSKDSTSFTVGTGGRGYDGTTAAIHHSGDLVYGDIVAAHHNLLAAQIIDMQEAIQPLFDVSKNISGVSVRDTTNTIFVNENVKLTDGELTVNTNFVVSDYLAIAFSPSFTIIECGWTGVQSVAYYDKDYTYLASEAEGFTSATIERSSYPAGAYYIRACALNSGYSQYNPQVYNAISLHSLQREINILRNAELPNNLINRTIKASLAAITNAASMISETGKVTIPPSYAGGGFWGYTAPTTRQVFIRIISDTDTDEIGPILGDGGVTLANITWTAEGDHFVFEATLTLAAEITLFFVYSSGNTTGTPYIFYIDDVAEWSSESTGAGSPLACQ